jgi:hypothetical protein
MKTQAKDFDTGDRLIDFRDVNQLIGSKCRSAHMARCLAKRGKIRAVYLGERNIRYSLRSVINLVNGCSQPAKKK